jgi:hypothetical protein
MISVMILAILGIRGGLAELATRKPLQHALRGCIGFFAPLNFCRWRMLSWFSSAPPLC